MKLPVQENKFLPPGLTINCMGPGLMYQCWFANGRIPFLIGSLDRERAVGTTPCLKRDEKGSESHDIVGRCTISSSLAGWNA